MSDANSTETHRSFTVRVPFSLYVKVATLAQADGVYINQKVNQLIKLGLGEHVNVDEAVRRLIMERVLEDGEPTNG